MKDDEIPKACFSPKPFLTIPFLPKEFHYGP